MSTNVYKNILRFQEEPESPGFDSRYRNLLVIFFLKNTLIKYSSNSFFFSILLEHIVVFMIMSDVLFFFFVGKAFLWVSGNSAILLLSFSLLVVAGYPNAPDHWDTIGK
jgi:hypothetical protein